MLAQVQLEDPRITEYPDAVIEAIGSVEELSQSCVVFSSFAGANGALWDEYMLQGDIMIKELPQKFPRAAGQDSNMVYHVEHVSGFSGDNDLYKYCTTSF